jgi:hypothetical protein
MQLLMRIVIIYQLAHFLRKILIVILLRQVFTTATLSEIAVTLSMERQPILCKIRSSSALDRTTAKVLRPAIDGNFSASG